MVISMIIALLLAYLIGSVPTSIWIGRSFYKLDIREHGSGNAGATNTIRVLGWKAGVPVLLFDVFKGWLAVWLGTLLVRSSLQPDQLVYFRIAIGAMAVIGHVFPAYVGFRGGKGVATLLGVGFALYPISAWVAFGIFLVTLVVTGYVSVSSIMAGVTFPFVDIFVFHQPNTGLIILAILVGLFIPFIHKKNIRRLLKGEEPKFRPGKRKSEEGRSM